jgi:hypothetical protein
MNGVCISSAALATAAVIRSGGEPEGQSGSRSKQISREHAPKKAAIYLREVRIASCEEWGNSSSLVFLG